MADHARRVPNNLMGVMDKVDKYINQEETLRTMIGSPKMHCSIAQKPTLQHSRIANSQTNVASL